MAGRNDGTVSAIFRLEILTPNRIFFQGDVEMVIVEGADGQIGIMAGHIPMVNVLTAGPIHIKKGDDWLIAFNGDGFMEVGQEKVVVFADSAEWPDEIDFNRAQAAKQRAEERLRKKLSHMEYIQSKAAIARAMARLKVSKYK